MAQQTPFANPSPAIAAERAEVPFQILLYRPPIEEPRFREALLQLGEMVELKGYLPQEEALAEMNEADYALHYHDPLNVAAKFYDYVGAVSPYSPPYIPWAKCAACWKNCEPDGG